MYRIKTLNSISSIVRDELTPDRFEVSDDIESPDAILVRSARCLEMKFPKELLAIARAGAGVNNIPVDRCTDQGIVVFNTPGANANAVKELVFAAMFMTSRNLIDAVEWCKTLKGKGEQVPTLVENGKKRFVGHELRGKTLGVIGLGAIGVMVANHGNAIGMNVIGHDPFISIEHAWGLSRAVQRAVTLDDLVQKCDYITLHMPLNDNTKNFFNERLCSLAKRNSVLLNFARGELVDNNAVLDALETGKLSRYIVDFPSDDIIGARNVVCIPHLGASTPESEENCAKMAAEQLRDYLENGNIKNAVNLPTCEMTRSGETRFCIINRNTPNMIGQFTALLSSYGANIANMINRSRGEYAYTIIDIDQKVGKEVEESLEAIEGVVRLTVF